MITIDKNKCKKCNACILQCPYNFIFEKDSEGYPKSNEYLNTHCTQCFHCVAICKNKCLFHSKCSPEICNSVDKSELLDSKQVTTLLKTRRSLRTFKSKPVEPEVLKQIMDLTRWSSTAVNSQEIRWIMINNPDVMRKISGLTIDWLREIKSGQELIDAWDNEGEDMILRNAPNMAIAIFSKDRYWAFTEASSALTYIELAANSFNLGACWAGYFTKAVNEYKPLKEYLKISDLDNVFGAMMLGYPKFKINTIPQRNEIRMTWIN